MSQRVAMAVGVLATAVLAGCTSTSSPPQASAGSATPTTTASSATPSTSISGSGSSSPTSSTSTSAGSPGNPSSAGSPSSPGGSSAPGIPQKCLSGTFAVVVPTTDNAVRSACVHMGTAVAFEFIALRGVTWSAPVASDPSVASISDQVEPIGTRHDQVRLLRPGTVTFSSSSSYGPDPHGPASRLWTLTLTVVP